jgi:signal transduction histidine kinase
MKIENKIAQQGFLLEEEIKLRRKDGEIFYASVSNTAVKDENGKSIYYDGIIEDITEKKAIQDNLIKQRNEMEELNNQLMTTEEESKRRLATTLHDGLGQSLAITKIKLNELSMQLTLDENAVYKEVLANLQNAINESRSLTYELSPPMLDELGLIPTIEWKIEEIKKKNDIKTELIDKTDGFVLDDKYQLSLYRTISEVIQNIVKHSQASLLRVTFIVDDENYSVEIFDDGVGFEYEKVKAEALKSKKFGLFSVLERIKYLKGNFKIDSNSNIGTTVTINFPKSIL